METTEKKHPAKITGKRPKSRAAIYAAKMQREVETLQSAGYDLDAAIEEAAAHTKY